jgi:cytochrome c-type biogenesis protein CcsB
MRSVEIAMVIASLVGVILALIFSVVGFVKSRRQINIVDKKAESTVIYQKRNIFNIAGIYIGLLSFLLISIAIAVRAIETGHGPFSNMYEFAIAYAWGILLMGFLFQWRYKTGAVSNVGFIVTFLLLIFAVVQNAKPQPLVPALQQSVLLSVHVASAVVAYGALTIGFGAAVVFLIQNKRKSIWLPSIETLDTMSYQSVIIGFPFLTALIVLGALWADIAWGTYWSWDPKETASLVTWLFYAAYLHARVLRGWHGTKTAILLIISFAAILLTFFGNYIFAGLHAYG